MLLLWYLYSIGMVYCCCYAAGMISVSDWRGIGMLLVSDWHGVGMVLVWYRY